MTLRPKARQARLCTPHHQSTSVLTSSAQRHLYNSDTDSDSDSDSDETSESRNKR